MNESLHNESTANVTSPGAGGNDKCQRVAGGISRALFLPPWIWLKRFRKRCGYGVHSPYAFDFITQVIYERGQYYAYKELDELHPWYVRRFNLRPRKLLRLLFRVVNFSEAKHAVFLGGDALALAYLRAAVPKAEWMTEIKEGQDDVDFLYIGTRLPDASGLPKAKVIVVEGLRQNASLWKSLLIHPHTTLSFDLYDVGIVMQGLKLNKKDYVVNF